MQKYLILRSQANDVFEVLKHLDLDPTAFRWEEHERGKAIVSKLVHIPTDYYYLFDFHQDNHWSEFSPGHNRPVAHSAFANWTYCLENGVIGWAKALKREIDSPDLWGAILDAKSISGMSTDQSDNTVFSEEERAKIRVALKEIGKFAISFNKLNSFQQEQLEMRLQYPESAANRLGRIDWKNAFAGALMGYILDAALSSETAKQLSIFSWNMLKPLLVKVVEIAKLAM